MNRFPLEAAPGIKILYEDDCLLAVDKPAGLVVNRSETQKDTTLQDLLPKARRFPRQVGGFLLPKARRFSPKARQSFLLADGAEESDFRKRGGIVHRLDKETSGVLLVAKTEEAFKNLQSQFKARTVKKTYIALLFGTFENIARGQTIRIDAPIKRNPRNREKFAVVADGKSAVTEIKILKEISLEHGEFTLVECSPQSGRTHQIRVHLAALNHPVAGDKMYSGKKTIKKYSEIFPRQFLHASRIEFKHPGTGEQVIVESPLPGGLDLTGLTRRSNLP